MLHPKQRAARARATRATESLYGGADRSREGIAVTGAIKRAAAKPASSCTRCDIPNCARTASMGSGRIDLPTAGRLCKRRENDVNELQGFSRGGVWLSQCRNRL